MLHESSLPHAAPLAEAPLRVMVVDADRARGRNLRAALALNGYDVVAELRDAIDLYAAVAAHKPEIIIVAADSPDRDTLEHISASTRDAPRPVVMFTRDGASASIRAAVRAGVSAYVVDGLAPERLQSILEVARVSFAAHHELTRKLADTERQLAERKVIEQAKGLLMQRRGMNEKQAYAELRALAMQTGKRLGEVSETLVAAAHLI